MVTKFDEIFSGYLPCQVSVLNQCFEDCLSYHHLGSDVSHVTCDQDGPQNINSVQSPDAAGSPRRFH
jgi:hypothetical protein